MLLLIYDIVQVLKTGYLGLIFSSINVSLLSTIFTVLAPT